MYAKVSFRMTEGEQPLLLVPTHINGRGPLDFILDTGAGICLVSPQIAETLAIDTFGTREGVGSGGKMEIPIGRVRSLSVGSARVDNVTAGITEELERISTCCGTTVHGVLGYNFFKDFRLTVDHERRTLALHRGQVYPDIEEDRQGTRIPFRLAHPSKPLAIVPVHINGRGPHPFVLDTGASTSILSSRLARELGIPVVPAPEMTGAGGMVRASTATLRKLNVGTAELEDVGVAVVDFLEPLGRAVGTRIEGIVGYNFLKGFEVTIDYPRTVVGLSQRAVA